MWSADLREENLNSKLRFDNQTVFSNTQLANLIFAKHLSAKCRQNGVNVSVNCVDVGRRRDSGGGWFGGAGTRFQNGVETAVHVAVSSDGKDRSGCYFSGCRPAKVCDKANDEQLAEKLWSFSQYCTNLQPEESVLI